MKLLYYYGIIDFSGERQALWGVNQSFLNGNGGALLDAKGRLLEYELLVALVVSFPIDLYDGEVRLLGIACLQRNNLLGILLIDHRSQRHQYYRSRGSSRCLYITKTVGVP